MALTKNKRHNVGELLAITQRQRENSKFTLLDIEHWTLKRDNCASLTGNKYIVSVPGTFSANFTVIDIVYIYVVYTCI